MSGAHWCMRYEPLWFLSPTAHFDFLGPNCTAQHMYLLKPTCSCYRKWCGSDDDVHTNTGRESPFRSKWGTPRFVSTIQFWWTAALPCNFCFSKPSLGQLLVQFIYVKPFQASRASADHKHGSGAVRSFDPPHQPESPGSAQPLESPHSRPANQSPLHSESPAGEPLRSRDTAL